MSADSQSPCHRPHWHSAAPSGNLRADLAPAMPRPRYRQDPPGLELMQQGHLEVLPLGPLFEGNQEKAKPNEEDLHRQRGWAPEMA
jgi:hypothetical protein